jgi:hypothetical protein
MPISRSLKIGLALLVLALPLSGCHMRGHGLGHYKKHADAPQVVAPVQALAPRIQAEAPRS